MKLSRSGFRNGGGGAPRVRPGPKLRVPQETARGPVTRHPGTTGALGLTALTLVVLQVLPEEQALDFVTAILVASAAVYVGAALATRDPSVLALEAVAGGAFIAVALLGRWYASAILAWGYLAHGVWDILHYRGVAGAQTGKTHPLLCWIYDWILAVVILLWF